MIGVITFYGIIYTYYQGINTMSTFLFWTWPILLFFAVAAIKGIFAKPRIKPGYAGFAEQEKKNTAPYVHYLIDSSSVADSRLMTEDQLPL